MRCVHEDIPNRMFVLEEHHHRGRRLRNLKRERLVHDAGHSRQETLGVGVSGQAVLVVRIAFLHRPGLVRQLAALDHTHPGGTVL